MDSLAAEPSIALRFVGYLPCSIIMALRQTGYSNSPSGTALRAVPRLLLAFPGYNKVALEERTHPNRLWARSFLGIDTAGNGWPRSLHGAQT